MYLPAGQRWVENFTQVLAGIAAAIIRAVGGHATATGGMLAAPGGAFAIRIAIGCDGTNVMVLLWSAIAAWPASILHKAKGLVLAAVAVQLANMGRIILLFYCGQWNQTWFEWMHLYVAEILIMLLGLTVFAAWIRRTPPAAAPDPAR